LSLNGARIFVAIDTQELLSFDPLSVLQTSQDNFIIIKKYSKAMRYQKIIALF